MKAWLLITLILFCGIAIYSQDFEVSPVSLSFSAEPGTSQTLTINVTNHDETNSTFTFLIRDFYFSDEGNRLFVEPNSIKKSCADWLTISPSFVEITPEETKKINITIQVPQNDFSTRWAVIFVGPTKERNAFEADMKLAAAINIAGRIAVEVVQSPASNRNYKAKVSRFSEITKLNDTIRSFEVWADNIGDKILTCKLFLVANNLSTGEETIFDPVSFPLYPLTSRKSVMTLTSVLSPGKYSVAAILDYGSASSLEGAQITIDVR